MINCRVGDVIKYHAEGFAEPRIAIVDQLLPNGCFCSASLPQYSVPITILVLGENIIEVMQSN